MIKRNGLDTAAVKQALKDLRQRTKVSLLAFNAAAPHAAWLKRSEIARISDDILQATANASRRRSAPFRAVRDLVHRIRHARGFRRLDRYDPVDPFFRDTQAGDVERHRGAESTAAGHAASPAPRSFAPAGRNTP